jgi:hypothetical protein
MSLLYPWICDNFCLTQIILCPPIGKDNEICYSPLTLAFAEAASCSQASGEGDGVRRFHAKEINK